MTFISAAWEGIDSQTITNCFRRAGFIKEHDGTFCAASVPVITNDDEDWVSVQEKLGDVNLEDFVSIDDDLMTSEIRSVDDMIADHATTANDDANEGDETMEENVSTRNEALGAINLLRKYMYSSVSNDATNFVYLNRIENVIIHNSQGQENKDVRKSVGSLLMSSMEVSRLEQHAYIKIAVLRGQNARECHAQLLEAVGARALPYRTVARWVAAFESGREATKDKPRLGRPRTVRTVVSRAVIQ
ncbi:hypothetical protein C0J52_09740 [Blattella germanica]|nr:hypothetical protein C0J52_09740 [Blattella germanica]